MTSSAEKNSAAELKVAVCQLTSNDDIDANVSQIEKLLEQIAELPVDLVCFPENALYLRVREGEAVPAITSDHPSLLRLAKKARDLNTFIHIGSVPMKSGDRLYNTSLLIEPTGVVRDVYRKIHLFDVDVEGHKPVRESDVFTHGSDSSVLDIRGWKIGSSICYDLRFSELYQRYAKAGVDAILIPSAFLVPTGRAHWEVLTRARAIESQAYVLAAAQGGKHVGKAGGGRETFGHSMIIDPWGQVVDTLPDDFGDRRVLRATLQKARIQQVRSQIPMAGHRRL
ncbi:MAG TPA: carbon-nitrogen hydrolase family protein [Bdellovibrionales bacterium]|nr:carbon-nitrogen hydrolase family protein [Bdellovibrionales bacterium]